MFQTLKDTLTSAPILIILDWSQPSKLTYDVSDVAIRAMLGQKKNKVIHPIYYAIKTLNKAQENYTTIEKELLAVVFAMEKFRSYIGDSKVMVHFDHFAFRYLMAKKDAKLWLIRWILLLQEYDLEIINCKGIENQVKDHLLRLNNEKCQCEKREIEDGFPDEQLFRIEANEPWYTEIVNYFVSKTLPQDFNNQQRRKLFHE